MADQIAKRSMKKKAENIVNNVGTQIAKRSMKKKAENIVNNVGTIINQIFFYAG